MIEDHNESVPSDGRVRFLLVVLVACWLGGVFFATGHRFDASTFNAYQSSAEAREEAVATGQIARRIGFPALGLMGGVFLLARGNRRLKVGSLPFVLIVAFYVLAVFSVTWSVEPDLTVKRLLIVAFCMVAVVGFARHLHVRELVWISLIVSAAFTVIGVVTELRLGTFQPWVGDYRFSGTVHPNSQGSYGALLVFSSFFLARDAKKGRWFFYAIMLVGLAFLVLTKSRSSLGGAMLALAVAWLLGASLVKRIAAGVFVPFAICSSLVILLSVSSDVSGPLGEIARLGRDGESIDGMLSGRGELWLAVWPDAQSHWLLGHGYEAYWNPANVFGVSDELGWTIGSAHNSLLDLMLSVGLVGTFLFLAAASIAGFRVAKLHYREKSAEMGFLVALLLFGLLSATVESVFLHPASLESFIAACGLVRVACCPRFQRSVSSARQEATLLPRLVQGGSLA